jgi:hypothetical protein
VECFVVCIGGVRILENSFVVARHRAVAWDAIQVATIGFLFVENKVLVIPIF